MTQRNGGNKEETASLDERVGIAWDSSRTRLIVNVFPKYIQDIFIIILKLILFPVVLCMLFYFGMTTLFSWWLPLDSIPGVALSLVLFPAWAGISFFVTQKCLSWVGMSVLDHE